jgi:hypothetical protein
MDSWSVHSVKFLMKLLGMKAQEDILNELIKTITYAIVAVSLLILKQSLVICVINGKQSPV